MNLKEIYDRDDVSWRLLSSTGNGFRIDYENLRSRYLSMTKEYDKSTKRNIIRSRIEDIRNIQKEIIKMYSFCKTASQDTETEEFMKLLKLMSNNCKEMITELERLI